MRWNGAAWTPSASGTTEWLTGVWGSGPNDVWVVGDEGTILRWNGSTWMPSSSGTRERLSAVWGSGPNDVWIAGDYGTVLRRR
jgi:photosystem II stability/assembly factor-like uncharacterized protein